MNILIAAIDDERWGPARLPKFMQAAGFRIAALCSPANPLAHTKYLDRRFDLPDSRSKRRFSSALRSAMQKWQPQLVIPADEIVVAMLQSILAGNLRDWPATTVDALQFSLSDARRREVMLFKNRTQELAREIGVRVPAGGRVPTALEAIDVAERLGYPVVV